ncbi:MAG: hypothetical protein KJO98_02195, partial [Rhodothermia bacterium]|nr:hypothetical protein [Rhodothermia bacterium]
MIRNYLIVALGTSRLRKLVGLSALLSLALAITGLAQPAEIVMFDEDDLVGADYREASYGFARDGDLLMLLGPSQDKMPVELNRAYSGASSGLLNWQHVRGGYWEMNVEPEDNERYDLTGFDTLIVFINGPDSISGTELPRVALRDIGGTPSPLLTLSKPENVRVNFRDTGFSDTSSTTIVLTPIYRDALPTDQRRPGYPDDLRITFSDVPLDTSIAAIGAPSTPAHFKVEATASQLQLEFSFRDLDRDRTLSSVGEFIDVRMAETEGAARTVTTWRIEVTSAPEPLSPPGNGDVYHLVLLWDEFALDSDPETWQRVALPLRDALSDPTWNATQVWLPVFIHGGPNDIPKTMWFDRISVIRNDDIAFIDEYQRLAFDYFWIEANPQNGLVKDRSRATSSVSSIAAVGFGLSAYTVGADRGWITREQAVERTLNTLRFFWNAPQSTAADATGYKGFFYHFLNMSTGRRAGTNELSTIDTALLLAGILHSREYYDRPDASE